MRHLSVMKFISVLLLLTNDLFAQPTIQWTKTIGGSLAEGVYSPNCIEQTTDGGFIISAGSLSTNGDVVPLAFGYGDYWIVKLDSLGNISWQKKYGGSLGEAVMAVKQSIYGGYYVVGYSQSNDGFVHSNHGNFDVWLLKLNSVGDTIWSKTYGGTSEDRASALQETSDGKIIFTGYTYSNNGDVSGNHGDWDYWTAMVDSTGNLLWQKTYGGTLEDQSNSIEKTTDGGFIIAGYTSSNNGDVTNFNGNIDSWVIKIDSVGNIIWQKCLGGSGIDKGYKAIQTNDGDYILSSGSNSGNFFIHDHIGSYDSWLCKLNSTGDTLWTKSYGGTSDDFGLDIQQTSDNGYIIGNNSNSNNIMVSGNHGLTDYWIYKIDSVGQLQWQKTYGGNSLEWFQAVRQTSDDGYILIGSTLSSNDGDVSINHGSNDLFIVKIKNSILLSQSEIPTLNETNIFPNPCYEDINVVTQNSGISVINIYNIHGQIIFTEKFINNISISMKNYSPGIFYAAITNNGITERIEIIKF